MTDNLIAAWALAAADDFGGSLDADAPTTQRHGPANSSGVPHCFPYRDSWRVRLPGQTSRTFATIADARAFVALHRKGTP